MNSRGQVLGTGILYFVYLLMMVMILTGLYGGIVSFFGEGYDIREFETRALMNSVKECSEGINFARDIFVNDSVFFERCSIEENVISEGDYLIYINDSSGKEFFEGVYDYRIRCGFDERNKNIDYPKCLNYCSGDLCFLAASAEKSRRVAS